VGASHMSKRHLLSHVLETSPEQASRVSQRAPELVTLNPKHARSKRGCVSQQAHSVCRIGRSARIRQKARGPQKQHGHGRRWGPSWRTCPDLSSYCSLKTSASERYRYTCVSATATLHSQGRQGGAGREGVGQQLEAIALGETPS